LPRPKAIRWNYSRDLGSTEWDKETCLQRGNFAAHVRYGSKADVAQAEMSAMPPKADIPNVIDASALSAQSLLFPQNGHCREQSGRQTPFEEYLPDTMVRLSS